MRLLAGILGAALLLAACGKTGDRAPAGQTPVSRTTVAEARPQPVFRNVRDGAAFVGDAACFDCHEDLWRGYQTHGMARSYYPLTAENAVEDFAAAPLRHEASGFYYRAFEEDGRFYQEEYRVDASGRKTHSLVRRMDYVVGSGHAARTYLTESNERLYELPLTWYTQRKRWDFSPGYDVVNGRFDRLIPDRCMACHNGYPRTVPFVEGKYEEVPHGIGCERCHGPGGLHVAERLADPEPPGEIDDTIVNPKHLDFDRQLDVCQQCHLHGTVSVLRAGRDPFDFRPSEPLAAHEALFTADVPPATDQIAVISHADRMKQSACFKATAGTAGAMTCLTCHNPHEGFREQGPAYFNRACLGCHPPDALQASFSSEEARRLHQGTADCFACHMPRVEAEDAPHASFTDHRIRVVTDEPDLPAPAAAHAPIKLTPYFEKDGTGPDAPIYEGMAYVILGKQQADTLALRQGVSVLEKALPGAGEHGEAQLLLGLAHTLLGHVEEAIPPLEEAVRLNPNIPERLNALAQAYEAGRRDPVRIERLYSRALSMQPALAEVRVNYGRFLEVQGRLDEAADQYRLAVEEEPWLAVAHYNLGTALLQQGDFAGAEAALREAVALNPDYPEALGNLGLLYAARGEPDKARLRFEQALAAAPNNPTALGNLGTFYLNEGDLPRAVDLLQRAVDVAPAYLDGLVNLSLAYFQRDDMARARRYAERALQIDPANATARRILAAL